MTTPVFPLGVLVAGPSNVAQLRVRLFKGPALAINQLVDLAAIQEVDTPGYEPGASSDWEDPYIVEDHCVQRMSKTIEFRCTGTNAGCNALGYYVTAFDGTHQVLVDIKSFLKVDGTPNPRPMDAAGKNLSVRVDLIVYDNTLGS